MPRDLEVLMPVQCHPHRPLELAGSHSSAGCAGDEAALLAPEAAPYPLDLAGHLVRGHLQDLGNIVLVGAGSLPTQRWRLFLMFPCTSECSSAGAAQPAELASTTACPQTGSSQARCTHNSHC